ncbi:nucleoside hydrolase [Tuberibacillus sp. Marseille-P3662]|uniref:nucleoside hydrolase n=1 Tax=Tuberibacillus sp. Marseille-P3662 TaxID=1965358 RepID=UPI0034E857CB
MILFADTGIDDTLAIIYALKHPNINLVGIVSGYGNVERNKTLRNAEYLLDLGDRSDIPVIAGATRPLSGEEPPFYPDVHGTEGLGPIDPPINEERYSDRSNFSKLFELIKAYEDDITIVNVGRMTSLAMAWNLSPETMQLVSNYYVMGGAFLVPGNVTSVAEANFYGDPMAADFVIQTAQNVTVIPLNVTEKALITPGLVDYIDQQTRSELGQVIEPVLEYYYDYYREVQPGIEGSPAHDLLAMMAVVDDANMLEYHQRRVRVAHMDGVAKGLSIADFRASAEDCHEPECDRIALSIDYNQFVTNFLDIMTRHV